MRGIRESKPGSAVAAQKGIYPMYHKVAFIGRPNVGKSTLFNRLIRSNRAITHDRAGITRDRIEGTVRVDGEVVFTLIDTGGVHLDSHESLLEGPKASHGFEEAILSQAQAAMNESQVLCLVVDGREGLTPFDEHLAAHIRRLGKPVLLVVNKVDGIEKEDLLLAEFHGLGFPLLAVSAEHGHNVRFLVEELCDLLPLEAPEKPVTEVELRLAMLGRPNAGKSSLVNSLSGTERMIVSELAGTTRDSIDVSLEHKGKRYVFVDTAGVRRRANVTDSVERFSVNASIKTTTKVHVTILVIDAMEGVTQQDKRLIDLLDERKTSFMIVVNKIDLVSKAERESLRRGFKDMLDICQHVPTLFVSAKSRQGLDAILPLAERIRAECLVRIGTGKLNRVMEEVLDKHQPPVVKRARAKFFYLTQAESEPPTFVFFVSDADRVPESYSRYLEKSLRRLFDIRHAPIRIRLRSSHTKKADEKK